MDLIQDMFGQDVGYIDIIWVIAKWVNITILTAIPSLIIAALSIKLAFAMLSKSDKEE